MPSRSADQHLAEARRAVWITRAEPGASVTAGRVALLGFAPIVEPLLRFHPIAGAVLDPLPGEALAFTSVNGVTGAARLTGRRDLKVFAVGDTTASAARALGFSDVTSASGDVEALSTLIIQNPPEGGVLHPAAMETAGDLVGALLSAGVAARKTAVYRTEAAETLPEQIAEALETGRLVAILLHSPRAAKAAAGLLAHRIQSLGGVAAVGLSRACLAPLAQLHLGVTAAAETPDEAALMKVLATIVGAPCDGR